MVRRFAGGVVVATLLVAGPAVGQQAEPASKSATPERVSHFGKFAFNLQGGIGYRGLFTYDAEYCGQTKDGANEANCLSRSPFAVDLAAGYGVHDKIELFLELRLGLERDFGFSDADSDGPRPLALSPGIRGYIAEIGETRFFSTVQLLMDFTDYAHSDGSDLGVRNINGFQFDVHNNVGLYLFFGEVVSWKRWLQFGVEAGLGVQARVP